MENQREQRLKSPEIAMMPVMVTILRMPQATGTLAPYKPRREKHTERKSWCQEPCLCSNQMEMFAQHRQQRSWPWHGAVANGVCHLKLKTPILFTKDSKAKGVRNWGKCAKLKQLFDKQWSSGLQRLQSSHGEAQQVHKIHLQGYSMLGVDLPPTPKTK